MKIKSIFSNNILKNILGVGVFRLLGVITNFLLVGLIYRYLSNEELNGIWLTISSVITWFAVFDFGMGNSLRNKLTETLSNKDYLLSKKYVSTTYTIMIFPTILIIIVAVISSINFDWIKLFNVKNVNITNEYLTLFILIVTILYSLNFYFTIFFAVLHASFKSYVVTLIQLTTNIINIIFISFLYFISVNDLLILGAIYIGSSLLVTSIFTLVLFKNKYSRIRPNIRYFSKAFIKDIFNIGMKFLVLQIAIIVLFNTDNILISKYIGVKEVTSYQLLVKLLSIYTIVLSIILTPIWTAVLKYSTNKEYNNIKGILRKLKFIYFGLVVAVIFTGFISPSIIEYWVGSNLIIENKLIFCVAIFTIIHMWCNIYQSILNGFNILNIQVFAYGISTISNIPISIFLVVHTSLGVSAIIIGTILSLIFPALLLPIYTKRHLDTSVIG